MSHRNLSGRQAEAYWLQRLRVQLAGQHCITHADDVPWFERELFGHILDTVTAFSCTHGDDGTLQIGGQGVGVDAAPEEVAKYRFFHSQRP